MQKRRAAIILLIFLTTSFLIQTDFLNKGMHLAAQQRMKTRARRQRGAPSGIQPFTAFTEEKIVYFKSPGKQNTEMTVKLAKEYAVKHKVNKMVVASISGATAKVALEALKGTAVKLIVVGMVPETFDATIKKKLQAAGYPVIFANQVKSEFDQIAQDALCTICTGVKVGVQVTMIAADAGLVNPGEEVVAVAGTTKGADSATVIKAVKSKHFEAIKVNKILCKPLR